MPRTLAVLLLVLCLGACGGKEKGDGPGGATGAGGTTPGAPPAAGGEIHGQTTFAFKPAPAGSTPVRGGMAVLPLLATPDSLNPFVSQSADASEIHDQIFPRLYEEMPDYTKGPPTFEPRLAAAPPTPGEDGLSLRIRLREATWSDGTPISAEDVRFSWEAAKNPDVGWVSASIVDFITDVEVVGERELVVHYSQRYPYQQMDINDVQIVPRHVFGQVPFEKWQSYGVWDEQAKVGGGPFVLEKVVSDTEIHLVRNPRYWRQPYPYLDRVVFRVIPDQRTQLTAIQAGDVDAMQAVPPKDAHVILESSHLNLYTYQSRAYGYVGWNCTRWPFTDARVRRAMTFAIDRENIVDAVFRGYADVAAPAIISSMWASNPAIEPLPFDPDEAERLLGEAGFVKNGDGVMAQDGRELAFVLSLNNVNASRKQMAEMIQANLREVGVRTELKLQDPNQLGIQVKNHEFDAYLGAWYVATKVDLKPIWHSSGAEGRFNYVAYADPRVDEIIDEARVMGDFEKARPLWYELQEILDRDQPYTMLYEPRGLDALHRRFQDVKVTALRTYQNLEEWWVPPDQRRQR